MFTCPQCDRPMIWGGDHDDEDADGIPYIISNHSCNECHTYLEYAAPIEDSS